MCPSVPQLDYTADYKPRLLANLFFFCILPFSLISASCCTHTHLYAHTDLLPEDGEGRENENAFDVVGSHDLIEEMFSPPDASMNPNDQGEQDKENPLNYNSL